MTEQQGTLSVALMDTDLQPIGFSMDDELIKLVATHIANESEARLPAPRTARYPAARARLMMLRQLAGMDPAADPDDSLAAWKAIVDAETLPDESDYSRGTIK